jgi:hypothetical protein
MLCLDLSSSCLIILHNVENLRSYPLRYELRLMLRNKFKKAGISDVNVTNTAINQLPNNAQLVITQKSLIARSVNVF